MNALRLHRIIGHNGILAGRHFFFAQLLFLQIGNLAAHIREHEEIGVFGLTGERLCAQIRQFDMFVFLVNNEVKWIGSNMHVLVLLLHIELLRLLQAHFYTRF